MEESLLRLALIGTALFLGAVVSVLLYRYRKIAERRDTKFSREEVLGRLFLRKIRSLGEEGGEPGSVLKKLSALMKSFFSELFYIPYEFDYVELNEELGKKGVDESLRREIIDYSMKVEEFQYGGRVLAEADISFIVERSVLIIRMITERKEEKEAASEEEEPKDAPEEEEPKKAERKPGKLSAIIDGVLRRPLPGAKEKPGLPGGETPDMAGTQVPEKSAPPEKEKPSAEEKVAQPEAKAEHAGDKKSAPPEKEKPSAEEKAVEQSISVPNAMAEKVVKLRKLLAVAEGDISSGNSEGAMEAYGELRCIYESMGKDERRDIYDETRRIIALYNSLLNEYKDALSVGGKQKSAG